MKKPTKKFSEECLHEVREGLKTGITGQMIADEYHKITGQRIGKSVVYRWLLNSGAPVEPLLGSGLALKAAFQKLKARKVAK